MKCTVCTQHGRLTNSQVKLKHKHLFITGCSNFKLSTITDHEKSKGHLDACDVHNAGKKPTETAAYKSLLTLNEKNWKQLDLKFRNVYAVIKQNRPISDYMWLNELDVPLIILYRKWTINKFLKKCRSGKTLLLAGPNVWQETKFICNSGFQRRRFLKIGQSETRIACGGHVC